MDSFEISTTVSQQGQVHVDGVPFAPGTQVHVTISTTIVESQEDEALARRRAHMQELFNTVKGFRQTPNFSREELYDRECLR
jgi:hypothetical protein